MPRGSSQKREREYEKLKEKFQKSGRYEGREKEVAARIVNQQRAQYGETKAEKRKDEEGKSPDRDLPIDGYQQLTVPQVEHELDRLDRRELKSIRKYETEHKNRKTLLEALDERLAA
jgi:hypothetical protein